MKFSQLGIAEDDIICGWNLPSVSVPDHVMEAVASLCRENLQAKAVIYPFDPEDGRRIFVLRQRDDQATVPQKTVPEMLEEVAAKIAEHERVIDDLSGGRTFDRSFQKVYETLEALMEAYAVVEWKADRALKKMKGEKK